jgi:hypothetical protein
MFALLPLTCLLSEVEWAASSPRYGESNDGRNADAPLPPFLRREGRGEGQREPLSPRP